jgi:hypothetical protein
MLGGGPASQKPRLTTKQIRGALASHWRLDVIALSTDVCVFRRFLPKMRADERGSRLCELPTGQSRAGRHG